jgi:hypothetical protein
MGVFSNMQKGHDNSFDTGSTEMEEQYQKMFKKIARDFVLIEDLVGALSRYDSLIELLRKNNPELIAGLEDHIDSGSESAILKAIEYRKNLEQPRNKRQKYRDVTDE